MKKLFILINLFFMFGELHAAVTKKLSDSNSYELFKTLDLIPVTTIGKIPTDLYGGAAPGPNKTFTKKLDGLICEKKEGYYYGVPACVPDCGEGRWSFASSIKCHMNKLLSQKQKEIIYGHIDTSEDYASTDVDKIWSKIVGTMYFKKRWHKKTGGPHYKFEQKVVFANYEGSMAKDLFDALNVKAIASSNPHAKVYSYRKELGPLKCYQKDYDYLTSQWLMKPKYYCVFKGVIFEK